MLPEMPDKQEQADDRRQLVMECLERTEESADAQRELLALGLQATEAGRPPDDEQTSALGAGGTGGAGWGSDRQWWRWQRLLVLQHLERLDTVLALYKGVYSPEAYRQLRDCTIAEVAAAFAAVQKWDELGCLLARHPYALLPAMLDALAAAPETADPKRLAPLLQQMAGLREAPPLARHADWVESERTVAELREHDQYSLLLATEPLAALSMGWRPPSAHRLAAWVCERALALDSATGQLAAAMTLLEAGRAAVHYSEQCLNELLEAAHGLSAILKFAASRGTAAASGGTNDISSSTAARASWRMTLREYSALEPLDRLLALLTLVGTDSLATDLRGVVAPFLGRMDGVDTGLLLRQALEREAASRLSWVVRFIQLEAEQRCLFDDSSALAKAAAAACYGCAATDAWGLMEAALGAAGEAVAADRELEPESREAATNMLSTVRAHLTAARLLTKHGLATPARMVRDANKAAAEGLVRMLLARVSRAKNSESRWVEVWMDLRTVQEKGLQALSEQAVRAELCAALLRCGQFRLAATYLQGLEASKAEDLVVTAAIDYFLSATSLSDKAIQQAQECLSVLPESAAVHKELAAVEAGLKLRALGIDVAPVQLHQLRHQGPEGSRRLLDQILASDPRLAQDPDSVLQLTDILGIGGNKHSLLLQAALAAFAGGDVPQAEGIALQLARQRHAPAWELAGAVAAHPRCSGGGNKQLLLSFALLHAPAEQLLALLGAWEAADATSASAGEGWLRPSSDQPASMQQPLGRQVEQYFALACAGSSTTSSSSKSASSCQRAEDALAAVSSLLALGTPGLQQWDALAGQHQPQLPYQQYRQALLIGLTAALLLALQPSSLDISSPEAVAGQVCAAEELLRLPPSTLLLRWQEHSSIASPQASKLRAASAAVAKSVSREQSATPSEAEVSDAGDSTSAAQHEQHEQLNAEAAAAGDAAERLLGLLVSAADARHVQELLPGLDAGAALAASSSDPVSLRQVVLQLAQAAARQDASSSSGDAAQLRTSPQRSVSRQMSGQNSLPQHPAVADVGSKKCEAANGKSGMAWSTQLNADKAASMLQDALQLAQRYSVPAWEVQLAFVQSLLLQHQAQQEQEHVQALLRQVWPALLEGPQAAAAALGMLLHSVWPASSSKAGAHLLLGLQLMMECCISLATAGGGQGADWEQAATVLSSCRAAAATLLQADSSLSVKPFLQPVLLPVSDWTASQLPVSTEQGQQQQQQQQSKTPSAAELAQQLLKYVTTHNVQQLAEAVGQLAGQQAAVAQLQDSSDGSCFPLRSSDVYAVLACKLLTEGGSHADEAVPQAVSLFQHMQPATVISLAAFAAADAACPLSLPLASPSLPDGPREAVLAAALHVLDSAAAAEAAASADDEHVQQLRQLHALLATMARITLAAGSRLTSSHLQAVRWAAQQMQAAPDVQARQALATSCLEELLVAGCDALAVLSTAFELAGLLEKPAEAAAEQTGATNASLHLVQAAAEEAVSAALAVMSVSAAPGSASSQPSQGDAIQNLFGVMRALDAPSAQQHPAAAPAVDSLRVLVWRQLQQHMAASEHAGWGGRAAAEARLQVLELLGSLGISLWAGWSPPAGGAAAQMGQGGFGYQQALLLARVVAVLAAADWPSVAQQCGLAASDFACSEAAESAMLRLVDAAGSLEQLQAVVTVLQQVLQDAYVASSAQAQADEQDEPGREERPAAAAAAAAHPLHRAWSAVLHAMLHQGHLAPALAALDESRASEQPGSVCVVTQQEAHSLLQATDAALGPAAAAALAALLPYPALRRLCTEQLVQAVSSSGASTSDLAAMPGMAPLLVSLAAEQPLIPQLASSNQQAFRQLCLALLQQEAAPLCAELGAGLSLRAAACAALAAQLVAARQYTAAGWLAMQFTALHPVFRVLDHSTRVLRQLLQSCSSAQPAGAVAAHAELPAPLAKALGPGRLAESLLHGLPALCDAALQQMSADLQGAA